MYDAVTAANVPADAPVVGGYDDGRFKWSDADWARFPNATQVHISSMGTNVGHVLDCEPGNPNALQAVDWILMRRAAGVDPYVYTAEWAPGYTWADVVAACNARGVALPHWWKAPGAASDLGELDEPLMVQTTYPGPYDVGVAADYLPGIDLDVPEDDDLTPEQADQLQAVYDWLAGTGNAMSGKVDALYAWDAGTGNTIDANVKTILTNTTPPEPPAT